MKAMILCAGLGTRLKPWTLEHPKALVPVGGVPMLKRVAGRLHAFGFDDITLNVHHFAQQIIDYVACGKLGEKEIHISDETGLLLDTGGGLLHAEKYLAADAEPFLVHNVDIISDADLRSLYDFHAASGNDVTLLVSDRKSERKLVFDRSMMLKGWKNLKSGETRPSSLQMQGEDMEYSFSGIYVMSPSVFGKMRENGFTGKFPIMDFFLAGLPDVKIGGFARQGLRLIDIGKPETLKAADLMLAAE